MSKYLCTFSGQFGDALWSLPTVRAISQMVGEKVDFAIMEQYSSVLDIIKLQPYIDKAFGVKDWMQVHNNHGAQPWHPPVYLEKQYERSWHLGYRGHPGINDVELPLVDYIAHQQGIKLNNPLPFIEKTAEDPGAPYADFGKPMPRIACAFNQQYADRKQAFRRSLVEQTMGEFHVVDVGEMRWSLAAAIIKNSMAFVGCRSANYVIAHGVKQRVVVFEPHPMRHVSGRLGKVFGCPYGEEEALPFNAPDEVAASVAKSILTIWRVQNAKEMADSREPVAGGS